MIEFVVNHRFIAISISSTDRSRKCWRPQLDLDPVMHILSDFKSEHHIESLPLYAFGGSSGGAFVGAMAMERKLVTALNLRGVVVQIMSIHADSKQLRQSLSAPVLFIPMVRDQGTLQRVHGQVDSMKDSLSTICEVEALPIGPLYFHRRIGGAMTAELSTKIYGGLKSNGFLDEDNLLKEDPRRSEWRESVKESLGLDTLRRIKDNLVGDKSAISEEMNVAFSFHELTTQCNEEMLRFIESIEHRDG